MATKKASAILKAISEELAFTLPDLANTLSEDGSGNPTLQLGDGGIGDDGAFVRCIVQPWTAKDIFGNSSEGFGPHVVQVVVEEGINTIDIDAKMLAACLRQGARVEVYESASGNLPEAGDIVASKLKATIDSILANGIISNQ